jgi:hypothetical protein
MKGVYHVSWRWSQESSDNLIEGIVADHPPEVIADHAQAFAMCYAAPREAYCSVRMDELGIPQNLKGADDLRPHMKWTSFDTEGRDGGTITKGIVLNSGVMNPDLLKGEKAGRVWAKATLKDRIDAIIAHEYEGSRTVDHIHAVKAAAKTKLQIIAGARKICRAMARQFTAPC